MEKKQKEISMNKRKYIRGYIDDAYNIMSNKIEQEYNSQRKNENPTIKSVVSDKDFTKEMLEIIKKNIYTYTGISGTISIAELVHLINKDEILAESNLNYKHNVDLNHKKRKLLDELYNDFALVKNKIMICPSKQIPELINTLNKKYSKYFTLEI